MSTPVYGHRWALVPVSGVQSHCYLDNDIPEMVLDWTPIKDETKINDERSGPGWARLEYHDLLSLLQPI